MLKPLKIILNSIKSIEFKICIDAGLNFNMAIEKLDGKGDVEEKEKTEKIFEKKGLERPVGTWETKRKQYFDIHSGKVKERSGQTLDYYNIKRGDDGTCCFQ